MDKDLLYNFYKGKVSIEEGQRVKAWVEASDENERAFYRERKIFDALMLNNPLPVKKTSFIITEDLTPTISLEDYCANWSVEPPHPPVKRMLIQRVADMVRAMHLGGVNHRDCYICHFLLHLPFDDKNEDSLKISVIDLHRAQIRNKVPLRWRNKDLTGLYFSSDNIGLTTRDYYRFLKVYFNRNLKDIIKNEGVFIEQVEGKARAIRERTIRKSL